MNQPTLFPYDRYQPVRTTDPQTSHKAAEHIAPKLGRLQVRMLSVFRLQTLTANEAACRCVKQFGGIAESYRKRCGELIRDGHIEIAGERTCEVTGMSARTYRAK